MKLAGTTGARRRRHEHKTIFHGIRTKQF
jgi:hypothetical protein